ncbi:MULTISPECIES: hypothetical protein [unclassified Lentimonas]|uniref:hypothetical protein n=1 Tax=unclassified Lentimonas TaxID=2630993 RepID=UPI001389DA27|nr:MULTISPECIES: hypothetical protein [unclassified Lentimonas]
MKRIVLYCLSLVSLVACANMPKLTSVETAPDLSERDYTFGYWLNGVRKNLDDSSPAILCLETGYYGFAIDLENLSEPQFGMFSDPLSYTEALAVGSERILGLTTGKLRVSIELEGVRYEAVACEKGPGIDPNYLEDARQWEPDKLVQKYEARLWESGRIAQHYDLLRLHFQDADGRTLQCKGSLNIVTWPESLTFTATLAPVEEQVWKQAKLSIQFEGDGQPVQTAEYISSNLRAEKPQSVTLNLNFGQPPVSVAGASLTLTSGEDQPFAVSFDEATNGYVAEVRDLQRSWKTGYTDIRDYDEFEIVIEHTDENVVKVPFLLDLYGVANVTGLCPILCDVNGVPTGIPVQISKNWHEASLGNYLRAYALLPATPGTSRYKLRIAYGFYGTLPSASHSQLSLVGYGGNGRWDQMSIGCWGETLCLDMDMSCVDIPITDVRMLMARDGLKGRKWNWTDASWGGDWLHVEDANGQKHYFSEMKTAYLAQGPCLTDVRYDGSYGKDRVADVAVKASTLRTDDYARTFFDIEYVFNQTLSAEAGWLFKMGRSARAVAPQIAYGNADGLIASKTVPADLSVGDLFVDHLTLTGEGPWWIGFPGGYPIRDQKWGTGSRALIIRSYEATFGGKTDEAPTVSMPVLLIREDGQVNLDLLVHAPTGVTEYRQGDTVKMDLEWMTFPRHADDYYGPNHAFREHLTDYPESWQTIYREVVGNDLNVEVVGGTLIKNYPILIHAEESEIAVQIHGGRGIVPIRFEGLSSATGYTLYQLVDGEEVPLDQSVHGNDFWQADYDAKTQSYRLTYNLPIDGLEISHWLLK